MLSVKIKFIGLVLASIVLLSLTACSDESAEAENSFEQTESNISNEEITSDMPNSTGESESGGTLPTCEHCVALADGTVIDSSYHQFSGKLIEYIGYEAFQEWTENYSDPEDINILTYIKDNSVPSEYIDEINSTYGSVYYYYDYNTEALYGGAEEYYTSDRTEKTLIREYLLNFKSGLSSLLKKSGSNEDMRSWSIAQAVSDFDISRDVIAGLDERASASVMGLCEIDIDALYALTGLNPEDYPSDESLVSFDFTKYSAGEETPAEESEDN